MLLKAKTAAGYPIMQWVPLLSPPVYIHVPSLVHVTNLTSPPRVLMLCHPTRSYVSWLDGLLWCYLTPATAIALISSSSYIRCIRVAVSKIEKGVDFIRVYCLVLSPSPSAVLKPCLWSPPCRGDCCEHGDKQPWWMKTPEKLVW